MADDIPQWARARAMSLADAEASPSSAVCIADAFARYIAAHEEPPVDPLVNVLAAVENDAPGTDKEWVERLRYRLAECGLEIREVQP